MRENRCQTVKTNGEACKNAALLGKSACRWHSADAADIARHLEESRRGGEAKAWGAMPELAPLADDPAVRDLDLSTAVGVRDFLGAALRALGKIPYSVKTAHAISALAATQRAALEAGDLEERLAALEQFAPGPRRVA